MCLVLRNTTETCMCVCEITGRLANQSRNSNRLATLFSVVSLMCGHTGLYVIAVCSELMANCMLISDFQIALL